MEVLAHRLVWKLQTSYRVASKDIRRRLLSKGILDHILRFFILFKTQSGIIIKTRLWSAVRMVYTSGYSHSR